MARSSVNFEAFIFFSSFFSKNFEGTKNFKTHNNQQLEKGYLGFFFQIPL